MPLFILSEEQRGKIQAGTLLEHSQAVIDLFPEERLLLVEVASHARVLFPDSTQQKDYLAIPVGVLQRIDSLLSRLLQQFNRFVPVGADQHPTIRENTASNLQGMGDVRKVKLRVLP